MSVAYYIVLDNPKIDFDNTLNGNAIANEIHEINAFCEAQDIHTIAYYHSQPVDDILEQDDPLDLPEEPLKWFSAREGIEWVNSLITKVSSEPNDLNQGAVLDDLLEYKDILEKAKNVGARWHIEIDF